MANTKTRMVKFRLITHFEKGVNQHDPMGNDVLTERIASMGQEVALRPEDEKRLDELGALYTPEEVKAIKAGKYEGEDAPILAAALQGQFGAPSPESAVEGEHGDVSSMDSAQLADYISENKLKADDVLALVPDDADEDTLNKFLDAESIATQSSPRKSVVEPLEARLNNLTKS